MEQLSRATNEEKTELMGRIGKVFVSESGFRMGKKYLEGLLSPVEQKTDDSRRRILTTYRKRMLIETFKGKGEPPIIDRTYKDR